MRIRTHVAHWARTGTVRRGPNAGGVVRLFWGVRDIGERETVVLDGALKQIEKASPTGLTSSEILAFLAEQGVPLSEATLRKYVQLGLLPRSVRVGQKGKHRGSRGMYPTRVLRQILLIKEMLADAYTIEQIQGEFLLLGGEIDDLEESLSRVFTKIDQAIEKQSGEAFSKTAGESTRDKNSDRSSHIAVRDVGQAESAGRDLLDRLRAIESRLVKRRGRQVGRSVEAKSSQIAG